MFTRTINCALENRRIAGGRYFVEWFVTRRGPEHQEMTVFAILNNVSGGSQQPIRLRPVETGKHPYKWRLVSVLANEFGGVVLITGCFPSVLQLRTRTQTDSIDQDGARNWSDVRASLFLLRLRPVRRCDPEFVCARRWKSEQWTRNRATSARAQRSP